jgi:hypothetical protein
VEISNFATSRKFKKVVVVSARVHPGESNASWLVHGLMSFLLSDNVEAQVLREHFVWQIVPMLNPDGVICGNYRCGLSGVDLNRQWRRPHKDLHSTVYKLKKLIVATKKKARLCMYLDLHGHSRKCGIFSYACGDFPKHDYRRFTVRMYPKLLSMLTPEFDFPSCRWKVGKGKRGTGRVVIAKDVGLTNTYTIEASFFGSAVKEKPEDDFRRSKGGCATKCGSDSEGSEQERASPSLEADLEAPARVILFTPLKLEEFGTNLARALVLQQNLGPAVQVAMQRESLQDPRSATNGIGQDGVRGAISRVLGATVEKGGDVTPSASGTPSEASDSESDHEQVCDATAEVPQQECCINDPLHPCEDAARVLIQHFPDVELVSHEPSIAARPYMGIDVAGVLQDFETGVASSVEAESSGSDSNPSDDNLGQQELGRLVRMFSRRRKGKSEGGHQASTAAPPFRHLARKEHGCTKTERWPSKRKARPSERQGRRERRMKDLSRSDHVDLKESKALPIQRTVAFGQTTYVVPPPRCVPSSTGSVNRALSTGSPTPLSPGCLRSFSDSQAITLFADIGVEKASGMASPDRDHRRLQGWSQQQWPAISPTSSRVGPGPGNKDIAQFNRQFGGVTQGEALVLLGTPPKDRFAYPQGGLSDARRLPGPSSIRSLGQNRLHEESSSLTRSRIYMRNASSTMLQWQRTCTTPLLAVSPMPQLASVTSSNLPVQPHCQLSTGGDRPSLRSNCGPGSLRLGSRPCTATGRSSLMSASGGPLAECSEVRKTLADVQCVEGDFGESSNERPDAEGTSNAIASLVVPNAGVTPSEACSTPAATGSSNAYADRVAAGTCDIWIARKV